MFNPISVNLPAHTYTAIRVDGKNFTSFTKQLRKEFPFSEEFNSRMLKTAKYLLQEVDGAFVAYVGSDEVSVVISDLPENTQKWFGGRLDKITSVTASIATASFNQGYDTLALFDARAIDLGKEFSTVEEYLLERRKSIIKNSISMLASHYFSHKTLMGVSTDARIEMLHKNDIDWNSLSAHNKFGTLFFKTRVEKDFTITRFGEIEKIRAIRTVIENKSPESAASFKEVFELN